MVDSADPYDDRPSGSVFGGFGLSGGTAATGFDGPPGSGRSDWNDQDPAQVIVFGDDDGTTIVKGEPYDLPPRGRNGEVDPGFDIIGYLVSIGMGGAAEAVVHWLVEQQMENTRKNVDERVREIREEAERSRSRGGSSMNQLIGPRPGGPPAVEIDFVPPDNESFPVDQDFPVRDPRSDPGWTPRPVGPPRTPGTVDPVQPPEVELVPGAREFGERIRSFITSLSDTEQSAMAALLRSTEPYVPSDPLPPAPMELTVTDTALISPPPDGDGDVASSSDSAYRASVIGQVAAATYSRTPWNAMPWPKIDAKARQVAG